MLKVGVSKVDVGGEPHTLNYWHIQPDKTGYVDASKYTPVPFDMLHMRTNKGLIIPGWWTGFEYYSHKKKKNSKIIAWRRSMDAI